jgi:hypothetical protein
MKLVPVAVFGELTQVGLQLIKILHRRGYLYEGGRAVYESFLDLIFP